MNKKLEFDKNKYIKYGIWKLLIVVFIVIGLILISLINKAKLSISDYKALILIIIFIDSCLALNLYMNYKNYKENFECQYKNGSLYYKLSKYSTGLESLLNFSNEITTIELTVENLEKIKKKFGRIYVYGYMTLQKTTKKTKVKILNKYSFPDYCLGEESLPEYVGDKSSKKDK